MAVRSALAVKTGTQSVTTSLAAATYAAETLDTIGAFTTGANTRMTVDAAYNGRYGRHGFSTLIANVSNEGESYKNGASYFGAAKHNSQSAGSNGNSGMSAPLPLTTADYYETMARNFSGTNNTGTNEANWSMLEIMPVDFNGAVVKKSTGQALSAATITVLTWDQEEYDLDGWHDNSVDNSRLTVPARGVELVRISGNIEMPAATEQTVFSTTKNGAVVPGLPAMDIQHTSSRQRFINLFSAPLAVAPGDYFEALAYNGSAQTLANGNNTWFAIERLPHDLKYALVTKTSNQAISAASNSIVTWDTEVADVGGWFDLGTPNRFTVPLGVNRIRVTAGLKGSNVANQFVTAIWKNGSVSYAGTTTRDQESDGVEYANVFTAIIPCSPGDYFQVIAYSNTARDVVGDADTWFAIEEVVGDVEYDEHLEDVVFHVVPTGLDASTTITDESPAAHGNGTPTNQAQIDTGIAKFGTCVLFDGANDRLDWADNADWQLGPTSADPWTIDLWARIADNTSHLDYVIGQRAGAINANTTSWSLVIVNGLLEMNGWTGSVHWQIAQTTGAMAINTWYHVAVDKDATGKVRLYLNGVMVASGTPADSAMYDTTTALSMGNPIDNSLDYSGGMSSVRLTKGVARYANDAGFTRPEAPAPLLAPGITSISPVGGAITGGTPVVINGGNFYGALGVTFDGNAATDVLVYQGRIYCTTPAGSAGAVDVEISMPGSGDFLLAGGFTYTDADPATVDSIVPNSGKNSGGTPVTITGTSFTGAGDVLFNGVPATSVVVVNDTTITCVTPAGPLGLVDVVVEGVGGTGTLEDGFEYVAAARVTQIPLLMVNLPNQNVRVTQVPLLVVNLPIQGALVTQIAELMVWTPTPIPLPLPLWPDVPVKEVWQYKTIVNIAERGREQRSCLRANPRILQSFNALIEDEEGRRDVYQMLFKYINRVFNYPLYSHATRVSAVSLAGTTKLYFDPAATDIRQSEPIALLDPSTLKALFVTLASVDVDGATTADPLPVDVPAHWHVAPAPVFRTRPSVGFTMGPVAGDFSLSLEGTQGRAVLRPGQSSGLLTLVDGMLLLDKRPLADDDVDEEFEQNVVWLDNGVAPPEPRTNWFTPFVSGERAYLVHRPSGMDYWRAVADNLRGRQKAFLLPTFRNDLPLYETPALGATEIKTSNVQFFDFWRSKAWRYIRIQSDAGVIYRRINEVVDHYDADGNPLYMTIKLASSIGAGTGANANMMISYVNTCRLDSDDIVMDHGPVDTVLTLKVRMVEE